MTRTVLHFPRASTPAQPPVDVKPPQPRFVPPGYHISWFRVWCYVVTPILSCILFSVLAFELTRGGQ